MSTSSWLGPTALLAVALTAASCTAEEKSPDPTKVGSTKALFDRDRLKQHDKDRPFHNPAYQQPEGRDGEQLPPAELDELIAEVRVEIENDRLVQAQQLLRKCANKEPPSGYCDAKLGLLIADQRSRKAEADYYLFEGIRIDDDHIDAAMYDELGEAFRKRGEFDSSVTAYDKSLALESTPERRLKRAHVLVSLPDRRHEAAEVIAELRTEEDSNELLFEEAVLRARDPAEAGKAAELFETYLERMKDQPDSELEMERGELELRIASLKALAEGKGPPGSKKPASGDEGNSGDKGKSKPG